MPITLYQLASRYQGIHELPGGLDHPLIRWWLSLCGFDPASVHDEVAWCSAFVNGLAWELNLPRSKSAMAKSWLSVGRPIEATEATVGWDLVILNRGTDPRFGHVGLFAGFSPTAAGTLVQVLAGNQNNQVSIEPFEVSRVAGYRRLYEGA